MVEGNRNPGVGKLWKKLTAGSVKICNNTEGKGGGAVAYYSRANITDACPIPFEKFSRKHKLARRCQLCIVEYFTYTDGFHAGAQNSERRSWHLSLAWSIRGGVLVSRGCEKNVTANFQKHSGKTKIRKTGIIRGTPEKPRRTHEDAKTHYQNSFYTTTAKPPCVTSTLATFQVGHCCASVVVHLV